MKCDECDGGRYEDPSHGCTRECKKCKGTGQIEPKAHKHMFGLPYYSTKWNAAVRECSCGQLEVGVPTPTGREFKPVEEPK